MDLTLLLTVAVTPTVTTKVAIADPERRAREYHAALGAWADMAERTGLRLVVLETTGTEASAYWPEGCPGSPITFRADPVTSARGKGAVEAQAIDRGLERIAGGTVYKCTGRLCVGNADRLLASLPANVARVRRTLDRTWVDGRFLGADAEVWRRAWTGMEPEIDDGAGRYIEHVLAERLARAEVLDRTTVSRFPARPVFVGSSGSMGVNYRSARERLKGIVLEPLESLLSGPLAQKLL